MVIDSVDIAAWRHCRNGSCLVSEVHAPAKPSLSIFAAAVWVAPMSSDRLASIFIRFPPACCHRGAPGAGDTIVSRPGDKPWDTLPPATGRGNRSRPASRCDVGRVRHAASAPLAGPDLPPTPPCPPDRSQPDSQQWHIFSLSGMTSCARASEAAGVKGDNRCSCRTTTTVKAATSSPPCAVREPSDCKSPKRPYRGYGNCPHSFDSRHDSFRGACYLCGRTDGKKVICQDRRSRQMGLCHILAVTLAMRS